MPTALMGRPMAESWLRKVQLDRLRAEGWQVIVSAAEPPLSEDDLIAEIGDVEYLFANGRDDVSASVIAAAPRLKAILRTGVGVDMVDLDAAAARRIPVCNTPGSNSETVADMALAMMLMLLRRVPELDASMRAGHWEPLFANNLHDKTVGIFGLGRIGRAVARRARAFRMTVLGFDPFVTQESVAGEEIRVVEEVDQLFAGADIVTLHAPATGGTREIVNAHTLGLMRANAIVINAARGDLVNEVDLLAALREGRIGGAGLDVFKNEPAFDRAFCDLPNVVLTPHVAGNTIETTASTAHACVDNALAVESGRWRREVVANGVYSD